MPCSQPDSWSGVSCFSDKTIVDIIAGGSILRRQYAGAGRVGICNEQSRAGMTGAAALGAGLGSVGGWLRAGVDDSAGAGDLARFRDFFLDLASSHVPRAGCWSGVAGLVGCTGVLACC